MIVLDRKTNKGGSDTNKSIERLRKQYPAGTQVVLQHMKGEARMPAGLLGTVNYVDDVGSVFVDWSNGSSLALIPDEDDFDVVKSQEVGMNLR